MRQVLLFRRLHWRFYNKLSWSLAPEPSISDFPLNFLSFRTQNYLSMGFHKSEGQGKENKKSKASGGFFLKENKWAGILTSVLLFVSGGVACN